MTPSQQKQQPNRRDCHVWLRLGTLVFLVLIAGGSLWYWREPLWTFFGNQAQIRAWVASFGPWGPLISILLNVAQVLLAPVPGQFVGLVNGYLYGIFLGTLYSALGLLIGSSIAMALGRWFGRPAVERFVSADTLNRWDDIAQNQGPLFFFLVFLFPLVPDDISCFLIGLSPLSILRMLFLTTLGRLPGVFVSCWIGAYATRLPWWAWIPLGGGSATLAWTFWRFQSTMEDQMIQWIERLQRKFK